MPHPPPDTRPYRLGCDCRWTATAVGAPAAAAELRQHPCRPREFGGPWAEPAP